MSQILDTATADVISFKPKAKRGRPSTKDKVAKVSTEPKETSLSTVARRARQFRSGVAISAIAVVATAVSVTHLAHGIEFVTRCPSWESWSLACVIDMGFVSFKACEIMGHTADAHKANETWGRYAIIATLILSAILNALTFSNNVEGWPLKIGACALGCFIPFIIMSAFKVGSAHLIKNR